MLLMTNDETELEQNPQYKQKSRTAYVNNNRKLCTHYVCNKYIAVLFFVRVSIKYMFSSVRVSQLSVHPLPTINVDNLEYIRRLNLNFSYYRWK